MSRIGRKPIPVPAAVKVSVVDSTVQVEGPKGKLSFTHREGVGVTYDQASRQIVVTRQDDERESRALHGLTRSLVANMVEGVSNGYTKRLEIVGVGYRVQARGSDLEFALGFSHPVNIPAPDGVTFAVESPTRFTVSGIDKQQVGEIAALIRKQRKPEPYKGKGIRYEGEYVARKVGKRA